MRPSASALARPSALAAPLAAVMAAGLLAGAASAQAPVPDAGIDSVFLDLDRTASPGCAVGVVRDGMLVFAQGYGSANLDHEVPITPETVFYMASVSKQFTAAAALRAAREGHLSLDDDIREWVPELPDYGHTITVRHLVHHTSGIRDYLTLQSIAGSFGGVSDEEVIALLARQKALNFPPGERYLYSNSGYFLLSEIVERATGLSLREYAEREFFLPLGMRYSHFHDDANHIVRNRATGYAPTADGWRMEHAWDFAQVGSGGLYSNVVDMARWITAFEAGQIGDEGFADAMFRRGVLNGGDTLSYAFGLQLGSWRGVRTIAHGGSLAGFRSTMVWFPDEAAAVTVLCNATNADPGGRARRVAELILGDRLEPETEPAEAERQAAPEAGEQDETAAEAPEPTPEQLVAFAGRYYSEELDATLTIVPGEFGLFRERRGRRVPLSPHDVDTFAGGGSIFRFQRDEAGRVTGFVLDAGRANGLVFQRVEENR